MKVHISQLLTLEQTIRNKTAVNSHALHLSNLVSHFNFLKNQFEHLMFRQEFTKQD